MAPKKKKARQQRPLENEILDPEIVLKEVRRCKALLEKQKPVDESTVDLSAYRVVKEMTGDKVAKEIHDLFLKCAESILAGNSFKFDVPSRAAGNQHYVPELDRIVLKQNTSERSFANVSQVRKTAIMTRVLSLVHEVTTKGIHVTKRDLFYTDVKLFKKQEESDAVLDDAACMIGCPRSCLNVVAADKGLVVGRLQFREDGDLIDCTRMGVTGKAIPVYKAASPLHRRRRVDGVPVELIRHRRRRDSPLARELIRHRRVDGATTAALRRPTSTRSRRFEATRSSCCSSKKTRPTIASPRIGSTTSSPAF